MNTNFRKFVSDVENMQSDKKDSITYNTLKVLSDALMLDEMLAGECDPVEFLAETLIQLKRDDLKMMFQRRIDEIEQEEK